MVSSDADSRTMNSVEKKAKQHKEKKKKDKVAVILDNSGTKSEIVKGGRIKGKKGGPEAVVGSGIVSCDPGTGEKKTKRKRHREDEGPPSADKKKKRKGERISGVTSGPALVILATHSSLEVVDTSEVTGAIATTSEEGERKKRRKSKLSAETSDPLAPATGLAPTASSTDGLEKPRKRKRAKGDAMNVGVEVQPPAPTEGRSSQKRRGSKQPAHPDPSGDPDLTEQSQKALTYVYSQSNSAETWKFNKARQNWVIRNAWTSKVPEKYLSMVVEYLSKVRGQARETLVESCKTAISGSNPEPPATQAETNGKSPSANANPSAPKPTLNEKRKWAETLLHALTSQS